MDLTKEVVVVTGADGFIGSHLVEALVERGIKTKAFVYYNSFNSYGWLDTLDKTVLKNIEVIPGDIRDANSISSACKHATTIIHLAALISIPFSYVAPDLYLSTNVQGTINVLHAAQKHQLKKVVTTSTSEVYGTAQTVPITEEHPINPQSPYAASKSSADHFSKSFFSSFSVPVAIARPFNTYGPRQSGRAVIPTIITQLLAKEKKIQLGSLNPTRDFCFVKDTVAGILAIAESDSTLGETINIGSGHEISIGATLNCIAEVLGVTPDLIQDDQRIRPKNSEVMRLACSADKLKRLTSWRPQYVGEEGFKKGIIETVAWFKNPDNIRLYKPNSYNI